MIASNDTNDAEMLTKLWYKRTREAALADYPLGPGDVLEISVPNLDEIQTFSARITGDGTITLPLVGVIQAANLTEAQLRDEIRRRLEAKYMRRSPGECLRARVSEPASGSDRCGAKTWTVQPHEWE